MKFRTNSFAGLDRILMKKEGNDLVEPRNELEAGIFIHRNRLVSAVFEAPGILSSLIRDEFLNKVP